MQTSMPSVVLLGAVSNDNPLKAVPHELSQLNTLLENHLTTPSSSTPFNIKHYPYFTPDDLREKLNRLQNQVAILHFSGHSNSNAVVSDNGIVYSCHIAGHIKSWRIPPALVVLNGCKNFHQVKLFHDAGVSVVIATHKPVNDETAANFAIELFSAMLVMPTSTMLHEAFQQGSHNALNTENRSFIPSNRNMEKEDAAAWDWDIFPSHEYQVEWTFHDLITTARPVLDIDGKLYNPYKKLEAFQEEDQSWFYGRDTATKKILDMLTPDNELKYASRFFSLLGASGSGKSSLINAGVIPQLKNAHKRSLILRSQPGNDPLSGLANTIIKKQHPNLESSNVRAEEENKLKELLLNSDEHLIWSLRDLQQVGNHTPNQHTYDHVFLIIDQFEELFTQTDDKKQVKYYLSLLINLIESNVPSTVIIIMRADFLASALDYTDFGRYINEYPHEMLSPMSETELRLAIGRPSQRQHVSLEDGLTQNLLNDIKNQAGGLPLLQFVLSLLWGKQEIRGDKRIILLDDYEAFGGLEAALKNQANRLYYEDLELDEKNACERIFRRLVSPGDGTGVDVRRRANRQEFNTELEKSVILKLAEERLITTYGDDKGTSDNLNESVGYVEVSHEALIRSWPLLRDWIASNRDDIRTQHHISRWTNDWIANNKEKDWLLSGTRLAVAEDWLEKYADTPNANELEFIEASQTEQECAEQEKEAQRKRQLKLEEEKRELAEESLTKTRRLSKVMAAIALMMFVVTGVAWYFFDAAEKTSIKLEKENLEKNYSLAKVFEEKSISAMQEADKLANNSTNTIDPTGEYRMALLYALEAQRNKLAKGKVSVKADLLRRLSLLPSSTLNTANFTTVFRKFSLTNAIIYSPNGEVIASGSEDNSIQLWNSQSGENIYTLKGHTERISSLAYSPDSKTLASGSADATIRLWRADTGEPIKTLNWLPSSMDSFERELNSVLTLAYSPDGKTIASGSADTIRLWNSDTGKLIKTFEGHSASAHSLSYSPDGKTIASGGSTDASIRLWNADTGKLLKTLEGHSNSIYIIAYSPDGKTIASGSRDATIRLWSADTGKLLKTLDRHPSSMDHFERESNSVLTLAYSPDSKVIASGGSNDGIIRLWSTQKGEVINTLMGHLSSVSTLAYSPDGKAIASGSYDFTVRLLNTKTGETLKPMLEGHPTSFNTLAYSPNGKVIASGSNDSIIRLWNTGTGEIIKKLEGHLSSVNTLAYSPDSKTLASGSSDGTIRLWNGQSGKLINTLEEDSGHVLVITYSPNGKIIASGSTDGTILLWNPKTGKVINTLEAYEWGIYNLAFSPDGKFLVSGDQENIIKLWNVQTGKNINKLDWSGILFSNFNTLSYSPDGKTIASVSENKYIRLWDIQTGEVLKILQGHTETISSLAYSPTGKVIASGSEDNSIRLWNAKSGENIKILKGHVKPITSLTYSPDGKIIASSSDDGTIRFWSADTGDTLHTPEEPISYAGNLIYSPDGNIIASGSFDGTIRLWSVQTKKTINTLVGHTQNVTSLVYSPDGKTIASGSVDTTIRLWNADSGAPLKTIKGHSRSVISLVYSPNGKTIASTDYEGNYIRLWDSNTGMPLRTIDGYSGTVKYLVYSPDGKAIASTFNDETIRLWRADTGEALKTLEGHSAPITIFTYSPDGKAIASGDYDGTIRLWNSNTGEIVNTLEGHTEMISSLVYSPDGKTIASGDYDGTIRLWNSDSGETINVLKGHNGLLSGLTYSTDGKVITSVSFNRPTYTYNIRFWNTRTGDINKLKIHLDNIENLKYIYPLTYNLTGKTIAVNDDKKGIRIWQLDDLPPLHRFVYEFDAIEVSGALGFLWELELENLSFVYKQHPQSLLPQLGHYITWTDETRKYRPLLDMPNEDETKMDQVVRWLEERCAYKEPEKYGCTPARLKEQN